MTLHSFVRSGLMAALTLCFAAGTAFAQATTGSAAGVVTESDGSPIAGATVTFTYQPTGFTSTATTNQSGAFRISGLEPGGPYEVEVSSLGFRSVTRDDVSIGLGQTYSMNAALETAAVELEALRVQTDALASQFSSGTQGSATTINQQQLESLPALDRRFENLARLTPQIVATDIDEGLGLSVIGQNNHYNTIQIDGATVNDRFGLGETGTAGGQARGKPIGYEAVKEFQVLLSPYDVRQGNFSGALINAVTKSGGNEFFGSAFGTFRNEGLAGDPLGESEFERWQYGASLGGPIIRDEAFFFVNAELQSASTPAPGPFAGAGLVPDADDLAAMNSALEAQGLEPGEAAPVTNENPLVNITGRGDWNLNERNRLAFRYSYNRAQDDVFSRSSSTADPDFRFVNNGYQFVSKSHNPSLQLLTNFENGNSNEFRISYNRIRDERDPNVAEPNVVVSGFETSTGCPDPSCSYGIETGSEQFSQGNRLNQDIWEITNNYTFAPMGDHTFTVGARAELYSVFNLFAQSSFGVYEFPDLESFQDGGIGEATEYTVSGSLTGGGEPVPPAEFDSQQFGFYAQDQWQASENLSITAGLRVDVPVFADQPTYADQVNVDFDDPEVPSGKLMLNPRVGFNLDLTDERRQQLRGGVGMFTGNPAYVWMANAYANNGTGISILNCGEGNPNGLAPAFSPDPDGQTLSCAPGTADGGGTVAIGEGDFLGEVDLIDEDTRFPQVFRANLAYDREIGDGLLMTLEGMYNRGLNDFFIVNRNFGSGDGEAVGVDPETGRVLYGSIVDGMSNPNYFRPEIYGTGDVGVFELTNTSNNWSYNLTGSLQKLIGEGLRLTGAYTYSKAKDVQSFTSSRATSNWRFGRMNAGDQLADDATISSFDRTHKVTLSGTYSLPTSEDWPTEISLIYIGNSGLPFTYISGGFGGTLGDLNADGIVFNDPLYVTEGPSDPAMTWASQEDAEDYEALINAQDCLSDQRGQIQERNTCRNPWQSFLDLAVEQGFPTFSGGQRVSVSLGVYNVLNLLNEDWGVIETAGGGTFDSHSIAFVSGADEDTGEPEFVYLGPEANPDEGVTLEDALYEFNGDPRSSWQLQLQLRYEF